MGTSPIMPTSGATTKRAAMSFPDALKEVIGGRKVTKLEWKNPSVYVALIAGFLMLKDDAGFHRLIISDGDLLGTDWVTCDCDD